MRAVDFMSSPVVSVNIKDSVHDVAASFIDKHIGAAIVLDDSGNEMGVITKTDLARYDRERIGLETAEGSAGEAVSARTHERLGRASGLHAEIEEETIETWINPIVYAVGPDASLLEVTNEVLKRRIHHLFVRDDKTRAIVGVISTLDLVSTLSHFLLRRGSA